MRHGPCRNRFFRRRDRNRDRFGGDFDQRGFGVGGLFQREFEVGLFLFKAGFLRLHFDQPLPVGDGDLVVIRVDFAKGEEPVPSVAVFDERGLQAGFYADNLGEVDVPFELAFRRCLDVEILESVTVQHHYAGFFRMRGVDQHTLRHLVVNSGTALVR